MPTTPFQFAQKALTALDFYSEAYASGEEFQKAKLHIAALLKNRAEQERGKQGATLLTAMAESLLGK